MAQSQLFELMDELSGIINDESTINAPLKLSRHIAAIKDNLGIEALCHLLVLETARRKYAESKYLNARRQVEEMQESA